MINAIAIIVCILMLCLLAYMSKIEEKIKLLTEIMGIIAENTKKSTQHQPSPLLASEMRKISKEHHHLEQHKLIEDLLSQIDLAAYKGERKIVVNSINSNSVLALTDLGYTVNSIDGWQHSIKW